MLGLRIDAELCSRDGQFYELEDDALTVFVSVILLHKSA